ncbi:MAG TPA: replicative DNA helicase [Jeotgalicoccus sp.]|uniref:replicative DNA helicase n=1 Tax=Jeotgalicoccus psychrophilus TaxID=157228 RepID=UPI000408535C|nr:replicative DNA helicase [Jeotgalicoccus psychrophilus]HBV22792.1 replicative DNA helicase [Jeotgalicoccus sp.]
MEMNRQMPHDNDAEQSVLGAIFIDSSIFLNVTEIIAPEDFYRPEHQQIFRAMMLLSEQNAELDVVTITDKLRSMDELNNTVNPRYLGELSNVTPTSRNWQFYADIIARQSLRRKLISVADEIASDGFQNEVDINELLAEAESRIMGVSEGRRSDGFKSMKEVVHEVYEQIESLAGNNTGITGIPTGYRDLDFMTSGFGRNDLIILAARPSMGKTAFALNIAGHVGTSPDGYTVAVFSLEMGADQLVSRMISSQGMIDATKLRQGALDHQDWDNFTTAIGTLANSKIFIDDSAGIRVNEIRAKCLRLKQEHGLDMVIIDYLQLIQGSGSRQGENRQQEVSEISRMLKGLAREMQCPVIALSQLSRSVETRQDKRPMMSDLRESGSIEQDADIVAFLYRDDYYNRGDGEDEEEGAQSVQDEIEIILAKHRNGPTGTVKLIFNKSYSSFFDQDTRDFDDNYIPPA